MSHTQEHDKFKFFLAPCASVADLKKLFKKVEKWVKESKVAPKSIGIMCNQELFDCKSETGAQATLMSLGFKDKVKIPYEVTLTIAEAGDLIQRSIEENIVIDLDNTLISSGKNSPPINKILCHELLFFDNKIHVIFMSKK